MERQINEVFRDGEVLLKVTEVDYTKVACTGCYYKGRRRCRKSEMEVSGNCTGKFRTDGKYVIFEMQTQTTLL